MTLPFLLSCLHFANDILKHEFPNTIWKIYTSFLLEIQVSCPVSKFHLRGHCASSWQVNYNSLSKKAIRLELGHYYWDWWRGSKDDKCCRNDLVLECWFQTSSGEPWYSSRLCSCPETKSGLNLFQFKSAQVVLDVNIPVLDWGRIFMVKVNLRGRIYWQVQRMSLTWALVVSGICRRTIWKFQPGVGIRSGRADIDREDLCALIKAGSLMAWEQMKSSQLRVEQEEKVT